MEWEKRFTNKLIRTLQQCWSLGVIRVKWVTEVLCVLAAFSAGRSSRRHAHGTLVFLEQYESARGVRGRVEDTEHLYKQANIIYATEIVAARLKHHFKTSCENTKVTLSKRMIDAALSYDHIVYIHNYLLFIQQLGKM